MLGQFIWIEHRQSEPFSFEHISCEVLSPSEIGFPIVEAQRMCLYSPCLGAPSPNPRDELEAEEWRKTPG